MMPNPSEHNPPELPKPRRPRCHSTPSKIHSPSKTKPGRRQDGNSRPSRRPASTPPQPRDPPPQQRGHYTAIPARSSLGPLAHDGQDDANPAQKAPELQPNQHTMTILRNQPSDDNPASSTTSMLEPSAIQPTGPSRPERGQPPATKSKASTTTSMPNPIQISPVQIEATNASLAKTSTLPASRRPRARPPRVSPHQAVSALGP